MSRSISATPLATSTSSLPRSVASHERVASPPFPTGSTTTFMPVWKYASKRVFPALQSTSCVSAEHQTLSSRCTAIKDTNPENINLLLPVTGNQYLLAIANKLPRCAVGARESLPVLRRVVNNERNSDCDVQVDGA